MYFYTCQIPDVLHNTILDQQSPKNLERCCQLLLHFHVSLSILPPSSGYLLAQFLRPPASGRVDQARACFALTLSNYRQLYTDPQRGHCLHLEVAVIVSIKDVNKSQLKEYVNLPQWMS